MSAADTLTFDILAVDGGARRPSLADVGGGTHVDDATYPPPKTGEDLYADEVNQWAQLIQAMGRVCPLVILSVTFSGGTPSIATCQAPGTNVVAGTFTVTDNSTGNTSISFTATDLPPVTTVTAALNGTTVGMAPAASKTSSTSIRVVTKDASNVAADLPFTVMFW